MIRMPPQLRSRYSPTPARSTRGAPDARQEFDIVAATAARYTERSLSDLVGLLDEQ